MNDFTTVFYYACIFCKSLGLPLLSLKVPIPRFRILRNIPHWFRVLACPG